MTTTDHCVACGRPFATNSRPRLALTRDGHPAGRVHASCSTRKADPFVSGYGGTILESQYRFWLYEIRRVGRGRSDADWAAMLRGEPSETMTADQEEHLRWWTEGPLHLGTDREPGIRAAYAALGDEFREWLATLDATVDGEGT